MQTEGERLKQFIESKGFNVRQFCVKNDILYNSFHPIVEGTRPLGMNMLKKITANYPNLNVNWILNGNGVIEFGDNQDSFENNPIYEKLDHGYVAFLKYLDKNTTKEKLIEIINEVISQKESGKKEK